MQEFSYADPRFRDSRNRHPDEGAPWHPSTRAPLGSQIGRAGHVGFGRRWTFRHVASALSQALSRYRTRQALARLSPSQLDDIGVTPAQAVDEAAKMPWH